MEKTLEEIINNETGAAAPGLEEELAPPVEEKKGFGFDFGFLTAETGEGNIEDYLDHPCNFNQSVPVARILRGFTGMLGSLRLAMIDIAFGTMEFMEERRGNNA